METAAMSRTRPWRPGGNALVLQAGGPTAVINSSLRGVIEECWRLPDRFGTLLGARHGVEGLLREELLDLSAQPAEQVALLASTPAAGILGTSRYPLTPRQVQDWERLVAILCAHQIGTVVCIGGNGAMAMAHRLTQTAEGLDLPISVIGVPKTVDNDLGDHDLTLIDHAPGYGSAARFWALTVQNALEENRGSCTTDPVLVIQTMGRRIGYLAAAARLADPERREPLLIFLPESGAGLAQITDHVRALLAREGRAVVVVSEGLSVGDLGALRDPSGQVRYSSSTTTAAQLVVNHLNASGVIRHGAARANVPGTEQRTSAVMASTVDRD
jgi:ATP-dependent phosphofructokinase / diphosphate-dependent phosphofructokinase